MILFAPCKINIGLDITARRQDGYHDLDTLMMPVDGLCDIVEVVHAKGSGAEFTSSGIAVDCDPGDNLCVKVWQLMHDTFGIGAVAIHLHKRVPFGAGLGGGSSDAASTLKALNELFSLGLSKARLEELGARLGSDVPFFMDGRPQMAAGRGEILRPFDPGLAGYHIYMVKPPVHISTAEAYRGVDPYRPDTPLENRLASPVAKWRGTVDNAFERSLFALHPMLEQIKRRLYDMGAEYASMSGSGSTLYGLFARKPAAADWPEDYFTYTGQL